MHLIGSLYWYPWSHPAVNNCNSYVLDGTPRTLVDPGHKNYLHHLSRKMSEDGFSLESVQLILLTHCHPDHMEGAEELVRSGAMAALHEKEETFMMGEGKAFYEAAGEVAASLELRFLLQNGVLQLGNNEIQVIHTPGHSPGSMSLYLPIYRALITGDLLFKGGIGRVDLPGSNRNQLTESLAQVSGLHVEYLLPGHGDIVQGRDDFLKNLSLIQEMVVTLL